MANSRAMGFGSIVVDSKIREELRMQNTGTNAAGYGSTNTAIRRYTNEVKNTLGSLLSYSDDAALGASITCLKKCVVHASATIGNDASNTGIGWSLNSNQLTSDITSISSAHKLAMDRTGSVGTDANASVSFIMEPGDILRPHSGVSVNISVREPRWQIVILAEEI